MDATKTCLTSVLLAAMASLSVAAPLTAPLTFVGITPCRIIDTRASQPFTGGFGPPSLVANASRTFQITGATAGTPTQCGIPDTAAAISVNFTVTGFSAQGDIRVYPAGGSLPLASIVNYQLENIANATTVPLGPSGSGHNGITVRADASATDFIADVNGYYVPAATLASGQTLQGNWSATLVATAADQFSETSISFQQRLAGAPSVALANVIPVAGPPTANCPGTSQNPQAAAGQLCLYVGSSANLNQSYVCSNGVGTCPNADPWGFDIVISSAAAGYAYAWGTWAVTAP